MNLKLSKAELSELKKVLQSKVINSIRNIDVEILHTISKRLDDSKSVKLYVDGAADLHTKTAGIGGVFYRNGDELFSFSEFIGSATNNEAEYKALIKGLEESHNLNILSISIFADSELVVKQINGDYKVKNERMQILNKKVINLLKNFNSWSIVHVPREKNSVADKLSKDGMRRKK
ncbi:MAG: reverse transcriptase-like protein [Planctomycetia bacterium]|nr:reverse transcriptase-like protein [Planctomycetia bacterium]